MSYFSRRYADVQLLDLIDEDDPGLFSFNVVETLEAYVPERGDAI